MSDWLIGVTAAAMLTALARCLMPPGAVQQVGSLVCAMVLLWAVLKPFTPLRQAFIGDFEVTRQTQAMDTKLTQQHEQLLKSFIEQECEAYIVDKAEQLGIDCGARVVCVTEEEGMWLPETVRVMGELSPQQRRELEQMIAADLGVERDKQEYLGGE